jgi:hypothetical protein
MAKKYVCISCGKLGSPEKTCLCGSNSFVVGEDFYLIGKKVYCGCNNGFFARITRVRERQYYKKIYECSSCRNGIEIHHYWKRDEQPTPSKT